MNNDYHKITDHSRIHFNILNYSETQVIKLSVVPEVCKDLLRSLVRDYRVYSIQSKDGNRPARTLVLSTLSNGAA